METWYFAEGDRRAIRGSLSVCGACVFHRWRSESLPAHRSSSRTLFPQTELQSLRYHPLSSALSGSIATLSASSRRTAPIPSECLCKGFQLFWRGNDHLHGYLDPSPPRAEFLERHGVKWRMRDPCFSSFRSSQKCTCRDGGHQNW